MSFPTKTLTIDGREVVVSCELLPNQAGGHRHRYLFTAKVGDASHQHGLTIGPEEGEFLAPGREQLQRDVDAAREIAARGAVGRLSVDEVIGEIE